MSKSGITQVQWLAGITAVIIYVLDWKPIDADPAIVSIAAALIFSAVTWALQNFNKRKRAEVDRVAIIMNDNLQAQNEKQEVVIEYQTRLLKQAGITATEEGIDAK